MSHVRWLDADAPSWMEALATVQHDFYHLPEYVGLEASRLDGEPRLFVYEERAWRFLCPFVVRRIDGSDARDAASPYGYSGPLVTAGADAAFLERASRSLVGALLDANLISGFVRLHPLLSPDPAGLGSVGALVRHGSTVSIDLRQSEAEMWSDIRTGHRNEIKRGTKNGYRFSIDSSWSDIENFLSIYLETMASVGAEPQYFFERRYFESLRDLTGANTLLASVRIENEPAAAAVMTEIDGLVQYHLSGARRATRQQQPTKYLLDQVRRWAVESGHHTLHLGGGLGGNEDGLFRFKAGFSKRRHDFFTWRIVPDSRSYEKLCARAGVSAGGNFFPAYRQRR